MTNKEIFTKAHKVARILNNEVGCYAISFKMALKAVYANLNLTDNEIMVSIFAPADFDEKEIKAATKIIEKVDGCFFTRKYVYAAIKRIKKASLYGMDLDEFVKKSRKNSKGEFVTLYFNGIPTWKLDQEIDYTRIDGVTCLKQVGETAKAIKLNVEYDLKNYFNNFETEDDIDFASDHLMSMYEQTMWVPKSIMMGHVNI